MERIDNNLESQKYVRAKKRMEEIKKFYKHLIIYLAVNLFFIIRRIFRDINFGDTVIEALTDVSNYEIFTLWGLFVVIHAIKTFGVSGLFDKNWEERKIKEFMN